MTGSPPGAGDSVQTNLAELLTRADQADPLAAEELFALLYGELRPSGLSIDGTPGNSARRNSN